MVTIKANAPSGAVVLSVADDGRGVAEGDRDRLFEPFFTTKRESGGSGLGLSIARSMLAANQGEIRLAPSTTGTCFEVAVPRASALDQTSRLTGPRGPGLAGQVGARVAPLSNRAPTP